MLKVRFQFQGRDYDIDVLRIAREHCLSQKKHEFKKSFGHYSFHYVQHGYGTLIVNGKKVSLSKGNAFLVCPEGEFEYYPDPLTPWTYYWIDLSGEGLGEIFTRCGFTEEKPYLFFGGETERLIDCLKHLVEGYSGGEVHSLACAGYVILLLSELMQKCNKFRLNDVRDSARFKIFRDILIFIDNNHRLTYSLDELCEMMNVTKTQLISMFNDYAGMTTVNYINRYRISLACVMLLETELDIKTIANMVGYDDVKYFTRVFTKWKGMSPRDYRNTVENENPYLWLKEKNIDFR